MKVVFKYCSEADLEELATISKETFVNAFEKDNDPEDFKAYLSTAFSHETLLEQLKNKNSIFCFVYLDEALVGYFKVNEFEAQNELKEEIGLELERIYVLNQYQGHKIGVKALHEVMALARQKNKTYIWLGVWEKNKRAIKWYQNNGFEKFGTHPYVIGKDEQTDWLMKKEI